MALVTAPVLNALRTSFNASFNGVLKEAAPEYHRVATVVPSSSKSNTYGWLGEMPEFEEWIGPRPMKSLKEFGYQIMNKTFAAGIKVKRDDIEDDNLGIYKPMVESLADKGMKFPDKLCFALLPAGFTSLCYDGQNFFDTDHPVNTKHDGSGTEESVSNIVSEADYTGPTWYVLDTTQRIKPLIFQDRRKLALTTKFNPNDSNVFTDNEFQFGTDLRCNSGYGLWQMAVAVKAPMTADNVWKAINLMESFKGDGGNKLEVSPDLIVAPTEMRKTATRLFERDLIVEEGAAVTNELSGKLDVLISKQL